jgi:hypothetical protein
MGMYQLYKYNKRINRSKHGIFYQIGQLGKKLNIFENKPF